MYSSPPFWEHGVFLQPQHFQLAHLQGLKRLSAQLSLLNPWLYGVRRLVINEDALAQELLEVVELELVLPTGDLVILAENATLPVRGFREAWTSPETPLPVRLGLSLFREGGNNVANVSEAKEASEQFRYTADPNPVRIPDLYGDGPEAEVSVMRYNLRLFFGEEESSDMWFVPLARLVREGERARLDVHFAPPCVDINAVPVLHRLVRDVRDSLVSRSHTLEEYKIVAGDAGFSELSSLHGITLFSILGVLSRNAPVFEFFLNAPSIHPWPVYAALAQLVGELSVFSASLSPLGETGTGERALLPYDHENLYACIRSACTIIQRLVDTLVVGPAFTFILDREEGGLLGTVIPQSARGNMYAYWLLLRTKEREGLASRVQTMAKLAPRSEINGIVSQALPGIRLLATEQPPAGLPRRQDTLYFMIEQNDPLWQKVIHEGTLSFMLPDKPEDLLAQLTVIQR